MQARSLAQGERRPTFQFRGRLNAAHCASFSDLSSFVDLDDEEEFEVGLPKEPLSAPCGMYNPIEQSPPGARTSIGRDGPSEWDASGESTHNPLPFKSCASGSSSGTEQLSGPSFNIRLKGFLAAAVADERRAGAHEVLNQSKICMDESSATLTAPPRTESSGPESAVDTTSESDLDNLVKGYLQAEQPSSQQALWSDEYCSRIQGVFFRACTRPPCLQDDLLRNFQFQYWVQKVASCAVFAALILVPFLSRTVGRVCGSEVSSALCWTSTIGIPLGITLMSDRIEILHLVLSALVTSRFLLSVLLQGIYYKLNEAAMLEIASVISTIIAGVLVERRKYCKATLASRSIESDKEAYDRVWNAVLQDDSERQAIPQVAKLCDHHNKNSLPALQCVAVGEVGPVSDGGAGDQHLPMVRVTSIDQLHQQSMLLQPMLRSRVQCWARRSRGWFKRKRRGHDGTAEFVRGSDLPEDEDAEDVAWATTKPFSRSTEKAAQLYAYNVSRLRDVTRESVWFDSLQDLATFLAKVSWDRWAVIVGVTNSLDPSVASPGGFRFVKLLVRFTSPEARELGLHGHVCEVLLTLKQFEASKTARWHERYIQWKRERPPDVMDCLLAKQQGLVDMFRLLWHTTKLSSCPPSGEEEDFFRAASQEQAIEEMTRRRKSLNQSRQQGIDREALLRDCMTAMKNYLWGTNGQLYGKVGAKALNIEEATASASFASCFSMKQPIASLLCRGRAQAMVSAIGLVLLLVSAQDMASFVSAAPAVGRHFRFTNLESSDGSISPPPCIHSLGVSLQGMVPDGLVVREHFQGSSMEVEYDRHVAYNGWEFVPADGPGGCAPSRFMLERWDDAAEAWQVVGSSTWFKLAGCDAVFEHGVVEAPVQHGVALSFRLGDAPFAFLLPLAGMLAGFAMLAAATCGYLKMPQLGPGVVKTLLAVSVIPQLLALALLTLDGRHREAAVGASWALSPMWWLAVTHLVPTAVLEAFLGSWIITLASTYCVRRHILEVESVWSALDPAATLGIVLGVGCKALVLLNGRAVEQAYRRDVAVYEFVWEHLCAEDADRGELEALKACADQFQPEGQVQQRSLPWSDSMDHDPDTLDPRWWRECSILHSTQLRCVCPPTQSIDQLYAQAEVAAVVMRHKLKQWALAANGLFLRRDAQGASRGQRQWARAADLLRGEADLIQWGQLKTADRALEKLFRSYGGDASKLLDLSRHSIVFQDPAHIRQCLQFMGSDPDVQIVRVKNDLHPSVHSPAGYRHVLVNLTVVTEETRRMGVSMHVSEVQLVLLGFALAKTDDGHKRYVRMRNARGE